MSQSLTKFLFSQRSARLIPEDDQIFTDVELNMLEKVINETMVGGDYIMFPHYSHMISLNIRFPIMHCHTGFI